jgi:hypothetical protein
MELLVLVSAAAALIAVTSAVAAVGRWRHGTNDHREASSRPVVSTAGAVAVAAFVLSSSATAGRALDVAVGGAMALVLLIVVMVLATQWRRNRQRHAGAPPVPRSRLPLVERGSTRPTTVTASPPRRPPSRRGGSGWRSVHDDAGREVFVYAMGAFDTRTDECRTVKLGITTALGPRLAQAQQEQMGRTETVRYLGWGPGGERREKMLHRRLDQSRYPASEWFEPSRDVLSEVRKLERLTDDGRRLTAQLRRSA